MKQVSPSIDCHAREISRGLKRIKYADTICIFNVHFGGRLDLLNMYLFSKQHLGKIIRGDVKWEQKYVMP